MRIDNGIEAKVRAVLHGAVKGNFEQFERAMRRFSTEDDVREGLHLAVAIAGLLLHRAYGHPPTPAEIEELAGDLAREEEWSQIPADEFRTALTAILAGHPETGAPGSNPTAAIVPYVTAAYLLATTLPATDPPTWWFDVLDEVETELESRSG